ncbi:MAG: hypothetical protein AB7F98_16185 [Novosphingobium sp.]
MRKIALVLASAAALLTAPALQAKERLTGEQQLAKLLEGREAGEPVNCIPHSSTREARIIDKTAIVYDWGNVIYVNRPDQASDLDDDDIMVTTLHGSQLCSVDVVRMHDRSSFFYSGFVGLNKFVPYRRVAQNN